MVYFFREKGTYMENKKEFQEKLLTWYDKNKRELPFRDKNNAYYTWVSEIMLQQTRVEAVKEYFLRFIKELPNIKALAEVEEEKLLKLWQGLGYYNRVRMLQKAAQIIVKDYNGIMPTTKEELEKLPGIGSYTAGAIASIAFHQKVPAVDGNVLRVFSRLEANKKDILNKKTKEQLEKTVISLLPEERVGDFNQAIMELGATVCIPNGAPLCDQCPVREYCEAYKQNLTSIIPYKAPKKARKLENRTVFIIECNNQYALLKRPSKGLLANLWEFYNELGHKTNEEVQFLLNKLHFEVETIEPLKKAKHIFSHIEWHMKGYFVTVKEPIVANEFVWVTKEQIETEYSIPNAFKAFKELLV